MKSKTDMKIKTNTYSTSERGRRVNNYTTHLTEAVGFEGRGSNFAL
jgi:hypothetical protein